MDKETTDHVAQIGRAVYENPELIMFGFGMVAGTAVLWLKRIFVTNRQLERFQEQNKAEHNGIISRLDDITDHLMGRNK